MTILGWLKKFKDSYTEEKVANEVEAMFNFLSPYWKLSSDEIFLRF